MWIERWSSSKDPWPRERGSEANDDGNDVRESDADGNDGHESDADGNGGHESDADGNGDPTGRPSARS